MPLKFADTSAKKRFDREGDDAWIVLRTSFSKRDDATVNDTSGFKRISTPEGIVLRGQAVSGDPIVFELLAVAWSLYEGTPKVEDYEKLDAKDAAWVDEQLSEAIAIARGEIEGKDDSKETQQDSPSTSPSAQESAHTD